MHIPGGVSNSRSQAAAKTRTLMCVSDSQVHFLHAQVLHINVLPRPGRDCVAYVSLGEALESSMHVTAFTL